MNGNNGKAVTKKWNRTMIQFSEEEYDRLWKEHAETRRTIAEIVRESLNDYFAAKDRKKKPATTAKRE